MMLEFQPVRVDTGSADEEGRLVFASGRLVAVLVKLSDQHDEAVGEWYLEHGFGTLDRQRPRTFPDLEGVGCWIEAQLVTVGRG